MRRCLGLAGLAVLMSTVCTPALGMEVEVYSEMLLEITIIQIVFDILWKLTILLVFGYLLKKGHNKKSLENAKTSVEMGVTHAYENFVLPLKHDLEEHPDGKLKEGERTDAKQWATNKAIEFATGGGKRLLIKWEPQRISNLIEKIVAERKKRK